MNIFEEMSKVCHDTRSANVFLKKHGLNGVRIQALRHTETECRRMYGLHILAPDHYYRKIYQSIHLSDVIQALDFYYNGRKEEEVMRLQDIPMLYVYISENPKMGEQNKAHVISARHNIEQKTIVVVIPCVNYTRNSVKFPSTEQNLKNLEIVQKYLRNSKSVTIRMINPVVKLFALLNNGNLVDGVSIKADSFDICNDDAADLIE